MALSDLSRRKSRPFVDYKKGNANWCWACGFFVTDEGLKGVIHVQVSFKNTLMTVTKVIDQVVSWSNPALEQGHNLLF